MFTGKRLYLKCPILGIESVGDSRVTVTVPTGAVIQVVGGPRQDDMRMVDVLWESRALAMFAQDIQDHCGKEIMHKAARC